MAPRPTTEPEKRLRTLLISVSVAFVPLAIGLTIIIGPAAVVGLGVATSFFLLAMIILHARTVGRAKPQLADPNWLRCPQCRYDLADLPSEGRCPECGSAYTHDDVRRSWREAYNLREARQDA